LPTPRADRWSRVDLPPVAALKRTHDRSVVMELERADASALLATGWRYPEVFVAKGRDGETDIWDVIVRPMDLDPDARYPVLGRSPRLPVASQGCGAANFLARCDAPMGTITP
jgi:hypothetical protein